MAGVAELATPKLAWRLCSQLLLLLGISGGELHDEYFDGMLGSSSRGSLFYWMFPGNIGSAWVEIWVSYLV